MELTYEELKAKYDDLQKQLTANRPARKPVELFVTPDGLLQIRNVLKNGSAHNLEPDVPEVLFKHAQEILGFVTQHKGILTFSTDDSITQATKEQNRKTMITNGNPIIRKPRAAAL